MRRFVYGIVVLMFLTGTLFAFGCSGEDTEAGDAFPKTETDDGNGEEEGE